MGSFEVCQVRWTLGGPCLTGLYTAHGRTKECLLYSIQVQPTTVHTCIYHTMLWVYYRHVHLCLSIASLQQCSYVIVTDGFITRLALRIHVVRLMYMYISVCLCMCVHTHVKKNEPHLHTYYFLDSVSCTCTVQRLVRNVSRGFSSLLSLSQKVYASSLHCVYWAWIKRKGRLCILFVVQPQS